MKRILRLNRPLLSPLVAFPAAWAFTALLSQFHLLNNQSDWSTLMVAVVICVPLAFVAGGLIGEGVSLRYTRLEPIRRETHTSTRLFRILLTVFLFLGFAELAHQFIKIGGVPLLAPNVDTLRFRQGGSTIVLTDLLTVAAIAGLVKPRNLLARESRYEVLIALAALGGFALQAGRGSLILPIVVAAAARWLYWGRPKAWTLGGAGAIVFAAIVVGFYLRTRQHPTNPFEAELYGEILPDTPFFLQPLIPLYLALVTNFVALQGIVGHFPTGEAFGHGIYDSLAFHDLFSNAQNLSEVSASLTAPWVTSTVAGPLWADGGFLALVPGVAITGFLSAGAFAIAKRTRSFRWSMAAGYLLYFALLGLYTNLWTQEIDWLLVVPLLLVVGAFVEDPESPPGVTGRLWGKLRRVSGPTGSGTGGRTPDPSAGSRRKPDRPPLIAGAVAIVWLLVAGLAVQATITEPARTSTQHLPALAPERLVGLKVAPDATVMTSADPTFPAGPWVLMRRGVGVDVIGTDLPNEHNPNRPTTRVFHLRLRTTVPEVGSATPIAVDSWGKTAPALFTVSSAHQNPLVRVYSLREEDRLLLESRVPLPRQTTDRRNFLVAKWSGPRPDLFVIDRNALGHIGRSFSGRVYAPWSIRIYSGESGFKRLIAQTRIRPPSEYDFWLDVGTRYHEKASLVLVTKEPKTGSGRTEIHILSGRSQFRTFSLHAATTLPQRVGRAGPFVYQSGPDGGAVLMVKIEHGQLSVRPLPLP